MVDNKEDLSADDLLGGGLQTWIVTGNTYPHRKRISRYGWRWIPEDKHWKCDHVIDENDRGLIIIRGLPGVIVTRLERNDDA